MVERCLTKSKMKKYKHLKKKKEFIALFDKYDKELSALEDGDNKAYGVINKALQAFESAAAKLSRELPKNTPESNEVQDIRKLLVQERAAFYRLRKLSISNGEFIMYSAQMEAVIPDHRVSEKALLSAVKENAKHLKALLEEFDGLPKGSDLSALPKVAQLNELFSRTTKDIKKSNAKTRLDKSNVLTFATKTISDHGKPDGKIMKAFEKTYKTRVDIAEKSAELLRVQTALNNRLHKELHKNT